MKIVPGLNCQIADDVLRDLKIYQGFLRPDAWVHLDIADGKFTYHKTWNDPAAWPSFKQAFNLEVHLMVEEPEIETPRWVEAGARRIIVHYEALAERKFHATQKTADEFLTEVLEVAWKKGVEVFLAVNPETPVGTLKRYIDRCAGMQVLAVHPGLSGQKFQPVIFEKIRFVRSTCPHATIEVDGGVTPEIAKKIADAGAHQAVSTSYILQNADPKKAYEELVAITAK